ncbi:MAG TPA: hypothetical protein VGC65_00310 [Bacteroidia bacterium]|jgi:hypothetical protein
MEKLTTIEACFIATGRNPKNLPIVTHLPEKDAVKVIADYQYNIVVEAINEGVDPDWANPREAKWELWPDVVKDSAKPSGFGLSYNGYEYTRTNTVAGARRSFRSREQAKFCWDNFQALIEIVYL